MSAKTKIIHIVTEDTKNPDHDKRCRYGWKGVDVIEKGTMLEEIIEVREIAGIQIENSVYYYGCSPFCKEVFQSIPTEIRDLTPSEQFLVNHGTHGRYGNLICHLLDAGKITNQDIEDYYNALPE